MKILIVTNHSDMFWRFRRELIEALMERAEVVLATPFTGHIKELSDMGCRCVDTPFERRGTDPRRELALIGTYRRLLLAEKPDLMLSYSVKPNIYMGGLCAQFRIPYCATIQGLGTAFEKEPLASVVTVMYRRALKKAKAVIFENENDAKDFERRGILTAEKAVVVQGAGVDTELFCLQPYPSEAHGICLLFVGRIMREKGIEEFLNAAKALKKRYGERVQFDLVGFYEEDYRKRVEQLAREGVLRFLGFQDDPRPCYAEAHAVVLPSYHEGMSNVLLEAASSGRALIVSDIPGCREAVEDGRTGFLCRKQDETSLEQCMERFLLLKESERREMGLRGREKMKVEFNRRQIVEQTLAAVL